MFTVNYPESRLVHINACDCVLAVNRAPQSSKGHDLDTGTIMAQSLVMEQESSSNMEVCTPCLPHCAAPAAHEVLRHQNASRHGRRPHLCAASRIIRRILKSPAHANPEIHVAMLVLERKKKPPEYFSVRLPKPIAGPVTTPVPM